MSSRVVGAGLALIAALLLAVQLATPAVLPVQLALFAGHPTVDGHTRHAQDVYVGLYTAQLCRTDSDVPCKSGQPRTPFRITAYGELAATGVLAVGAVVLALLTLRRSERRKDAARVVRIAGALAILLLVALVLVSPFTEASTPLGMSADPLLLGMPLYLGGVLGAMLASVIAVRPPPPIKLRVAERAPQAAAPHDGMYANDPTRAADARARRDSRGPIPEPMDPMDPFGASGPLRPLYEATPMQGGTGGLLPMTPSRPSSIPTPYGAEAFGAEPSRPLPFAGQAFDAPRGFDARAQSIGADARAQLPPPRSKSASMPPPARTQLSYVPPMPEGAEGNLFAGAEDPLASAPSQLGPPSGFPSAYDGGRFEGGQAYAPPAGHAPPYTASAAPPAGYAASAAPPAPYASAPSAATPRIRPETPLAPPPPPSAPWSDDASTFAPPFDPSLDPSTGSFDISMEPSEIAPPPVPLIPASVPSQAPPHARTMIQPAAQPTMVQPAAQPPAPQAVAAQSSTVTAPPPIPSASPPPIPPRAGPTAPPPLPPGARQSGPVAAQASQSIAPAAQPPAQSQPLPVQAPVAAQSQPLPVQAAQSQPLPAQASQPFVAQAPEQAPAPTTAPAPGPSSPPSTLVAAVPPAGPPATVAPLRAPRDTQAPRAQRESQAPRPLRAAVPMPARPSQSSTRIPISATRPPPRPTISAPAVPPPAIPPIPAIPIPAIPALPKRPEPDEDVADGSTAARVPIEISDNNSQTNVSFGIPSADELEAAVAEARAARAPDTAPTGEPVAPQPTPAPAQSRPMPKLPISTAPDTLPPPKDSKQANGPSPACPQCESPMNWVEEHLRFYCKSCRMYF